MTWNGPLAPSAPRRSVLSIDCIMFQVGVRERFPLCIREIHFPYIRRRRILRCNYIGFWQLGALCCKGWGVRVKINPLFNPKSLTNKLGAAWLSGCLFLYKPWAVSTLLSSGVSRLTAAVCWLAGRLVNRETPASVPPLRSVRTVSYIAGCIITILLQPG